MLRYTTTTLRIERIEVSPGNRIQKRLIDKKGDMHKQDELIPSVSPFLKYVYQMMETVNERFTYMLPAYSLLVVVHLLNSQKTGAAINYFSESIA